MRRGESRRQDAGRRPAQRGQRRDCREPVRALTAASPTHGVNATAADGTPVAAFVPDDAVVRRTKDGWRVGSDDLPDLTCAMILADLLAAENGMAEAPAGEAGSASWPERARRAGCAPPSASLSTRCSPGSGSSRPSAYSPSATGSSHGRRSSSSGRPPAAAAARSSTSPATSSRARRTRCCSCLTSCPGRAPRRAAAPASSRLAPADPEPCSCPASPPSLQSSLWLARSAAACQLGAPQADGPRCPVVMNLTFGLTLVAAGNTASWTAQVQDEGGGRGRRGISRSAAHHRRR